MKMKREVDKTITELRYIQLTDSAVFLISTVLGYIKAALSK